MIEINRAGSEYIFRQNPFQPRAIDRRKNKHNARWEHFVWATTEESAREMLLKLQREDDEDE